MDWKDTAKYCQKIFGSYVNWEEKYFICPECGEPVYECDWEDHDDWFICPVCETMWEDIC